METKIRSPKVRFNPPTLSRLIQLMKGGQNCSLLRKLEYERLKNLSLSGRVLDFGGGERANYSHKVDEWLDKYNPAITESVNIDNKLKPTFLVGAHENIPVDNARYDTVISFNTLEHVLDLNQTLSEFHRVLKCKGSVILIVPFIFRVHAHPNDYSRLTANKWKIVLGEHGLNVTRIEALNWGPFSTAGTISGYPGPFCKLREKQSLILDALFYMKNRYICKGDSLFNQEHAFVNRPLGYFIEAKKN